VAHGADAAPYRSGWVFLPTKPYTPRHKHKVERGVKYAKNNALKGRVFASLAEQNKFLEHWEIKIADTRLQGATKRQVGQKFEESERRALRPLPPERFPFFHERRRIVYRRLWVRWDAHLVRIYNDRWEQVPFMGILPHGPFARPAGPHTDAAPKSICVSGSCDLV